MSKVIVVMPLTALMEEQVSKLTRAGYCAAVIKEYKAAVQCLRDNTQFLIVSPEVLCDVFIKIGQENPTSLKTVDHVFIDESHCVTVWGTGHKESRAFRAKYATIGDFRSVCPTAVYVAMTATATQATEVEICRLLQMSNYKVVRVSPEKFNLRYSVVATKGDVANCFQWIVDDFKNDNVKKTLVFFKDLNSLGAAYRYIRKRCPQNAIAMYHGHSSQCTKRRVVNEFCRRGSSELKVVLCSSAFSMGLDIPDIRLVIHYGVPLEMDQYIQESGRAGRDGLLSSAVVIRHDSTLAGGKVGDDMKQYLLTNECRRAHLLSVFGEVPTAGRVPCYLCCDNCSTAITCCSCYASYLCTHSSEQGCYCVKWCRVLHTVEQQLPANTLPPHQPAIRVPLNSSQYNDLESQLLDLVKRKQTVPQNVNTIYPELIKAVLDNLVYIDSPNYIYNLGAYNLIDAQEIWEILNKYFL